ncbi:MAG: amidophosphoribosyltransferase [Clostridia bacterium]
MTYQVSKPRDACGVFGIYTNEVSPATAKTVYYALYALQHRGQESAGIAIKNGDTVICHKDMGLVPEVFNNLILSQLSGNIAIGHVRYSTTGGSDISNAQPMVLRYKNGNMALAHNGNLVNAAAMRLELEAQGCIFQSTNDTEVIANLISRYRVTSTDIVDTLQKVICDIEGSYALVLITPKRLIGIRDPYGIRPLCIGRSENAFFLASESCAFDAVDATFIRDVEPGEIVLIGENGIESVMPEKKEKSHLCIFEHVYFARPDSIIDGAGVSKTRIQSGVQLAKEYPSEADVVVGVPDGGMDAALGYSRESGIPFGYGLIRNKYTGRTFIQPEQTLRDIGVRTKFNCIRSEIEGKRVVLVDDSIVRGTTTKQIVQMLRDAGAREVHMRISSPPYKYPCYFGIDTSTKKQLVASKNSVAAICRLIGADTLGYLSLEGLLSSPEHSRSEFCISCFTGKYPIDIHEESKACRVSQEKKNE